MRKLNPSTHHTRTSVSQPERLDPTRMLCIQVDSHCRSRIHQIARIDSPAPKRTSQPAARASSSEKRRRRGLAFVRDRIGSTRRSIKSTMMMTTGHWICGEGEQAPLAMARPTQQQSMSAIDRHHKKDSIKFYGRSFYFCCMGPLKVPRDDTVEGDVHDGIPTPRCLIAMYIFAKRMIAFSSDRV